MTPEPALGVTDTTGSTWASPRIWHSRQFRVLAIVCVAALVLVLVRLGSVLSASDDRLNIQVGNQAISPVDLRQSLPISPYLFGANVFPASGTTSVDKQNGFMNYGSSVVDGLRSADVKLLRFPGGSWGELHLASLDQLNSFSELLSKTGAQGMIQARLSGSQDIPGLTSSVDRANLAGRWVDYMDNRQSSLRVGKYAHAPYYPVSLWAVGNEPDITVNPDTGKSFTVDEYVRDFIQYSISMHQNNPTIKVFGPEISRYNGLGAGPYDAHGKLWMEGFLTGVADYEASHPELKFHLLDGVSFHFYPGSNPNDAGTSLMTNAESWSYILEPLREQVRLTLGRDASLAVTEINSYATGQAPTEGLSALWWADTLGTLMNQQVEYVAYFSAEGVDSPYPLLTSAQSSPTSMLRVMELYSHLQSQLIPMAAQRNPISLYATQDESHQTVSLLFVNKASLTELAQVSGENQFLGVSRWPDLNISLSPLSITVVTMHRAGGADAYSFQVNVSGGGSSVPPLTHTICGNKSDALAQQIPC